MCSLCLVNFAQHAVWLQVTHSRCCFGLHSANILYFFIIPLCCARGLFPDGGYYEECCNEHAHLGC